MGQNLRDFIVERFGSMERYHVWLEEDRTWRREQGAFERYVDETVRSLWEEPRYRNKMLVAVRLPSGTQGFVIDGNDFVNGGYLNRLMERCGNAYTDIVRARMIWQPEGESS